MRHLAALIFQMEKLESEVNSKLTSLRHHIVRGQAAEGLVTATGDIWFNLKSIHIDREGLAAKTHDLASLESAVVEAVNNTTEEARKILRTEIGGIIGGQIPKEFANFFGRNQT